MEVDSSWIDGLLVCGVDWETKPFLDQTTTHQRHIACRERGGVLHHNIGLLP